MAFFVHYGEVVLFQRQNVLLLYRLVNQTVSFIRCPVHKHSLEGVLGDTVDIVQPLFGQRVLMFVNLLHHHTQVHRFLDDVIIIRHLQVRRTHWDESFCPI